MIQVWLYLALLAIVASLYLIGFCLGTRGRAVIHSRDAAALQRAVRRKRGRRR